MFAGLSRAAYARIIPFVLFMVFLSLRGFVAEHGLAGIDARWIYGLGVIVVAASLIYYRREYVELRQAPDLAEIALSVLVGLAVFWMWIHLDADWMQQDHLLKMLGLSGKAGAPAASFTPVDAQGHLIWSLIVVRWIGAALLVPVMEELFWRSFLMRWVDRPEFEAVDARRVTLKAILMSSGVFMLAHTLWFAAFLTGLIYAWLYKRRGHLWAPIIAHGVTNGALGVWVVSSQQWQFW